MQALWKPVSILEESVLLIIQALVPMGFSLKFPSPQLLTDTTLPKAKVEFVSSPRGSDTCIAVPVLLFHL